jgi:hypothetical protein
MFKSLHLLFGPPTKPPREGQSAVHKSALSLLALIGIAYAVPSAAELREGHFRIGVLVAVSASTTPSMAAFVQGLQNLGYVEGQNTVIDERSEGEMGRLPTWRRSWSRSRPT